MKTAEDYAELAREFLQEGDPKWAVAYALVSIAQSLSKPSSQIRIKLDGDPS